MAVIVGQPGSAQTRSEARAMATSDQYSKDTSRVSPSGEVAHVKKNVAGCEVLPSTEPVTICTAFTSSAFTGPNTTGRCSGTYSASTRAWHSACASSAGTGPSLSRAVQPVRMTAVAPRSSPVRSHMLAMVCPGRRHRVGFAPCPEGRPVRSERRWRGPEVWPTVGPPRRAHRVLVIAEVLEPSQSGLTIPLLLSHRCRNR